MIDSIMTGVGAGLSYLGARQANQDNREMAREQMDFQERMSNTAYQRSMEDMRKAGLNPILAYNQGGASSPGGSSANMQNELGAGVSSALSLRRAQAEVDNLRSQNVNLNAQTGLIKAQTAQANSAATLGAGKNVRDWIDTGSNVVKDVAPWLLLALRKGLLKF